MAAVLCVVERSKNAVTSSVCSMFANGVNTWDSTSGCRIIKHTLAMYRFSIRHTHTHADHSSAVGMFPKGL